MKPHERLKKQVERQAERMRKAQKEQASLLAQTVFIGTLGLLFVVPMVAGAFLGSWIDQLSDNYSADWTLNLIILGTLLGAINVALFIRRH
jgi:ATP synthase protein I